MDEDNKQIIRVIDMVCLTIYGIFCMITNFIWMLVLIKDPQYPWIVVLITIISIVTGTIGLLFGKKWAAFVYMAAVVLSVVNQTVIDGYHNSVVPTAIILISIIMIKNLYPELK